MIYSWYAFVDAVYLTPFVPRIMYGSKDIQCSLNANATDVEGTLVSGFVLVAKTYL